MTSIQNYTNRTDPTLLFKCLYLNDLFSTYLVRKLTEPSLMITWSLVSGIFLYTFSVLLYDNGNRSLDRKYGFGVSILLERKMFVMMKTSNTQLP